MHVAGARNRRASPISRGRNGSPRSSTSSRAPRTATVRHTPPSCSAAPVLEVVNRRPYVPAHVTTRHLKGCPCDPIPTTQGRPSERPTVSRVAALLQGGDLRPELDDVHRLRNGHARDQRLIREGWRRQAGGSVSLRQRTSHLGNVRRP